METVELEVTSAELLENKWLNFQLLSKKLGEVEVARKLEYKSLRNRFYNSRACGKYDMKDIAGLACINVDEPMKGEASLILSFKRV
jgi:hypothetical protein